MIFQTRKQLAIVESEKDYLSFEELSEILLDKPMNIIYVEEKGVLKGIISTGDICRAGQNGANGVFIKKDFMRLSVGEYMKARTIFVERPTISALPVLNTNGVLEGNYTRWDDSVWMECNMLFLVEQIRNKVLAIENNVGIVRPGKGQIEKRKLFQEMEEKGAFRRVIELEDVSKLADGVDALVFYDMDAVYAARTRFGTIQKTGIKIDCYTMKEYFKIREQHLFCDNVIFALHEIQKAGVQIIAFDFESGDYLNELKESIKEKYRKYNLIQDNTFYDELKEEFFDDLYEENYLQKIVLADVVRRRIEKGISKLQDIRKPGINVVNGIRKTTDQPREYIRTVYMYGPCVVAGSYVDDQYTIASYLQKKLKERGIRVVNKGGDLDNWIVQKIASDKFEEGDIIIFDKYKLSDLGDIYFVNMSEVYEKNQVPATWFTNNERHCNHKINALLADRLYEEIEKVLQQPIMKPKISSGKPINLLLEDYIKKYFYNFEKQKIKKIGAIVMNCNPFTLGHKYFN